VDYQDGIISMPVLDSTWAAEPFFPVEPEVAFRDGHFDTSVNVLLGSNREEGLLFSQLLLAMPVLLPVLLESWDLWGPILVLQKKTFFITEEDRRLADWILDQYTGTGRNVSMEQLAALTNMFTDSLFQYGIDRYLDCHLEHSNGGLYQYVNAYINEYSQASPPPTARASRSTGHTGCWASPTPSPALPTATTSSCSGRPS
jgi:hypothetical protein